MLACAHRRIADVFHVSGSIDVHIEPFAGCNNGGTAAPVYFDPRVRALESFTVNISLARNQRT